MVFYDYCFIIYSNLYITTPEFEDYFEHLNQLRANLKDTITDALEIKSSAFYNKLHKKSWSRLEREKVEELYLEHVIALINRISDQQASE